MLAFEDLQWADPTTLDLLRGIAERGALAPLFVLITARPEFRPPWGMRSHHGTISLAPLDRQQVRHMVGELAARHALPKEVIDGVTERTGGVPLFVEEVTRLLLERGEQGGIQAIPPTLQQSLTARLDRLGPAREVAQIGAVIGRDFSYPLLRAVAGMEDAPLQMALERLAEADILLVQGLPPDADYRFKHALIQDAAYENLLKSRRQVLHRRVGETLRDKFAGTAAAEPELLAHHFTQAGMTEAAIEWWGKAGQRSLERSALVEAAQQFTRALDQIAASARHSRVAPPTDQASSRAHNPTRPCQRVCCAGNQGGAGASPSDDRTSRSARRASRRPTAVVLSPLRLLAGELHSIQRRRRARACGAVLSARREASGASPANDRASPHGHFLAVYWRHRGKPSTFRSGDRALRSCRASSAGDAIWP